MDKKKILLEQQIILIGKSENLKSPFLFPKQNYDTDPFPVFLDPGL